MVRVGSVDVVEEKMAVEKCVVRNEFGWAVWLLKVVDQYANRMVSASYLQRLLMFFPVRTVAAG